MILTGVARFRQNPPMLDSADAAPEDGGSRFEPLPDSASTSTDYVALLRRVRAWSGLSLREIQRRAAAAGSSLPASTLSSMLARDTLPNERLVAALLTACGEGDRVDNWLKVRRRLAANDAAPVARAEPTDDENWPDTDQQVGGRDEPAPSTWRQLPMDIEEFTGRKPQLRQLTTAAEALADNDRTAAMVVAITGMAGVGKTRLAVHASHRLVRSGLLDEVQLWADLRGFDPHHAPADPGVVLENFLKTLGVAADRIPDETDARAALYRGRIADKRTLILLDNAADEHQVLPLLPGGATSMALITSRRSLTTLIGARHLDLDVFTPDEALELMSRLAGRERVEADPQSARHIVDLYGRLPLAIVLAARRLETRPTWSLRTLATRLARQDPHLDRSSPARSVWSVFDLSYNALPPSQKRQFRLLGAHLVTDIDLPAAAAVAGLNVHEAEYAVESLLDAHLVVQQEPDRYRMHDQVRLFARDRAERDEPVHEVDAAFERLMDHYAACAMAVTRLVHPSECRRLTNEPADDRTTEHLTTAEQAVRWIEHEHHNLPDIAEKAARASTPVARSMIRMVIALYRPLITRGHTSTLRQLNLTALEAARQTGDRRAEAQTLEDLGTIHGLRGRLLEAIDSNNKALAIWRELGDATGQAGCLTGLGIAHYQQKELERARDYLLEALPASREAGYRIGEASILNYLGLVHQGMNRFDTAVSWLRRSVDLYRKVGSTHGEALALANLGWTCQRSGRPELALRLHQRSQVIFAEAGDRYNEAEQHWALGEVNHAQGNLDQARCDWHRTITMLHDLGLVSDEEAALSRQQEVPATPQVILLNS